MRTLKLYDSLTGQKQTFEPLEAGKLRMYVCGVTVYDFCHIGHARIMVAFDMITRYLRQQGWDLTYVRNITDVDDKIIRRAAENGETTDALTERFIRFMHEDERALGVLPPDVEPRATDHIREIIRLIETLIGHDVAYVADNGDVYFQVEKFDSYGKLSHRKLEDMLAGARIDIEEAKRNPLDFVLWKAAKSGEVAWPSPWGDGRPGWHIECSAMSMKYLGESFDIHGGGPDLKFPHHENEIAQSEAATGKTFARYWMHAGAVRVNKEKMSKSLGNFFTIRDVLKQHPAEVIRFFLVSSHYRSPIDYSEDSLHEARQALDRFYNALEGLDLTGSPTTHAGGWAERFHDAMHDDFNSREAIAVLFEMAREINRHKSAGDTERAAALGCLLVKLAEPLGILQQTPEAWLKGQRRERAISEEEIEALIAERTEARANKNWAESDRIRDVLKEKGVILKDGREGTTWQWEA
ncbi:MAG: cysteine--tRNA ligase [Gammaproteobacteria bacterium]|nr:MAG: cysteine--tRNA ligase [Gammaproteobacteria bacterium]